jgi:hypothetical protein
MEGNIRMDLRETEWKGVELIHLAQDRDQWWAVVNTVMNLRLGVFVIVTWEINQLEIPQSEEVTNIWRVSSIALLMLCRGRATSCFTCRPMYTPIKAKVKNLALFLNKHHAMKRNCRSGGITPCILILGTRWRCWSTSCPPS